MEVFHADHRRRRGRKAHRPHAWLPTANILPDEGCALPSQNGVYAALLTLADGRALPCVLNKGRHPTLPEGRATVEAFVLDFTGDLYRSARPRRTFSPFCARKRASPDKEALRAQIARDTENARAWFAAHPH